MGALLDSLEPDTEANDGRRQQQHSPNLPPELSSPSVSNSSPYANVTVIPNSPMSPTTAPSYGVSSQTSTYVVTTSSSTALSQSYQAPPSQYQSPEYATGLIGATATMTGDSVPPQSQFQAPAQFDSMTTSYSSASSVAPLESQQAVSTSSAAVGGTSSFSPHSSPMQSGTSSSSSSVQIGNDPSAYCASFSSFGTKNSPTVALPIIQAEPTPPAVAALISESPKSVEITPDSDSTIGVGDGVGVGVGANQQDLRHEALMDRLGQIQEKARKIREERGLPPLEPLKPGETPMDRLRQIQEKARKKREERGLPPREPLKPGETLMDRLRARMEEAREKREELGIPPEEPLKEGETVVDRLKLKMELLRKRREERGDATSTPGGRDPMNLLQKKVEALQKRRQARQTSLKFSFSRKNQIAIIGMQGKMLSRLEGDGYGNCSVNRVCLKGPMSVKLTFGRIGTCPEGKTSFIGLYDPTKTKLERLPPFPIGSAEMQWSWAVNLNTGDVIHRGDVIGFVAHRFGNGDVFELTVDLREARALTMKVNDADLGAIVTGLSAPLSFAVSLGSVVDSFVIS